MPCEIPVLLDGSQFTFINKGDDIDKRLQEIADFSNIEVARLSVAQSALDEIEAERIESELEQLDKKTIRSLRAIAAGTSTADDVAKLADLEAEAIGLRDDLEKVKKEK